MNYALGIDGGGSKTDAVLVDTSGNVAGWGRGGSVHCYYNTPEEIQASYRQAIEQALGDLQPEAICLGGLSPKSPALDLVLKRCTISGHVHCGEIETAFASVQTDWGMIILSGTGSFAYGLTREGKTRHFGGMGPILGDYGSAYQIGLYGLRAAFSSHWTPNRATTLETEVPKVYDLPDLRAVFNKTYGPGLSRREIASVARVVDEQAEAGDRVAIGCIEGAADELAALALDVISELQLQDLAFPMIAIGSVAQQSRLWWERLCERVREAAPQVQPIVPRVRPAVGAALLALREMGVEWTEELVERIVATQGEFLKAVEASH
ncbi:MAG: BadF/BadG/BcrA/BcrD ATPase family protein [Armatimonadia bacterium]